MNRNVSLLVIMGMFATNTYAGQEVGNGGDIIVCTHSSSNNFNGYYALDYILTHQGLPLVNVSSWQKSLRNINLLIKSKVPELYLSFKNFEDNVYNTSYSRQHVWEPAPFGLIPIDDQNIAVSLPSNCLENGQINLIQAVIRLNPDYSGAETQIFRYMPSAIATLDSDRPLQTSFLFVHEWLWELSRNVDRNRRVNRYLHSAAFATHSSEQAVRELRGMGLVLTGNRYAFDSLQTAIDDASEGSTIVLFDKSYGGAETVTISKKGIRLQPFNADAHPIITGFLDIKADNVSVEGIAFDRGWISINSIGVRIAKNSFKATSSEGIWVGSGNANIIDNSFDDMHTGIFLKNTTASRIENNRFTNIESYAVAAMGDETKIIGNTFVNAAIYAGNSSGGSVGVDHNIFQGNSRTCIGVQTGGMLLITKNDFFGCKVGITIQPSFVDRIDLFTGNINGNQFSDNDIGIDILSGQNATIDVHGNRFENNRVGIKKFNSRELGTNYFSGNGIDVEW